MIFLHSVSAFDGLWSLNACGIQVRWSAQRDFCKLARRPSSTPKGVLLSEEGLFPLRILFIYG